MVNNKNIVIAKKEVINYKKFNDVIKPKEYFWDPEVKKLIKDFC